MTHAPRRYVVLISNDTPSTRSTPSTMLADVAFLGHQANAELVNALELDTVITFAVLASLPHITVSPKTVITSLLI